MFLKTITFFLVLINFSSSAQTNVSGGIYTNTIWTLANSPYIVTDTVVVFPGVTLTIEPGVLVKFADHTRLEIRNACIIAEGTASDSITFTSNSTLPVQGIWENIMINNQPPLNTKFNYCNFHYAKTGLKCDTLTIKNSSFSYNVLGLEAQTIASTIDSCVFIFNEKGLAGGSTNYCKILNNQTGCIDWVIMNNCIIDSNITGLDLYTGSLLNCEIKYNQVGMLRELGVGSIRNCVIDSNSTMGVKLGAENDSLINCEIKNNGGIGVEAGGYPSTEAIISGCKIENNLIGIHFSHTMGTYIYCNKICNNISYDLQYEVGVINYSIGSNYWCSNDSTTIASHIFDGYDNVAYGLVSFFPIDTLGCFLQTDIHEVNKNVISLTIYPNPTFSSFTIKKLLSKQNELLIINMLGEIVYMEKLSGNDEILISPHLQKGIYFVKLIDEEKSYLNKLIIE